jgi:hypothetical protein
LSVERYYLIRIPHTKISFNNMTRTEKKLTKEWKWWSLEEIQGSSEAFFMDKLYEELNKIINGNIPEKPVEI